MRRGGAGAHRKKVAEKPGATKRNGFDWLELIKNGALAGLKPQEIWALELWEYNVYVSAHQEKQKGDVANAILSGYYAAYYTNGGKKAKNPQELIKKLYVKKQNLSDGLKDIEQLKELEKVR